MKILVTGGAGYIGSHTCLALLEADYEVVVVDNLSNSSVISMERVEKLSGKKLSFYEEDLLNEVALSDIFDKEKPEAVIHFAGLKAVGESVEKPLLYYHNNITGTINLLNVMRKHGVYKLVFSSSATVYGMPDSVPIKENFPLSVTNPYGQTKLMIENILRDLCYADDRFNIVALRYFNPIGAHKSGIIGEDPSGIPNNLVPYVTQVIVGKLPYVNVFGNDYDTHDGTGVRDYIHVLDLANGHLKAIEFMTDNNGFHVYNLGTGNGYSVLDIVKSFEKVIGRAIPYKIVDRRPGDIAECYADPSLAKKDLGWEAKYELKDMCEDSYRWQKQNPLGYEN